MKNLGNKKFVYKQYRPKTSAGFERELNQRRLNVRRAYIPNKAKL